ncbi:histidine kinase dimerization/phospho-acceptor domain-containing protein [Desulfitobacterium sp.]|uniref:histidine kinase dimerization/phospho-acceptor domain-containing protein n=1 Tax=Desulfitobacterium sp. TaxID=49981 RepID=UPI002B8ECB7C|nr:histidine kinase dimerization/phospho-acceptor domain-containing protein [Desulfitobacterium sp.]HVJ50009.1 histidine kinase dimerization/phospho-acceptor domain-containing protein [Desulfitobacterium sp.]
MVYRPWKQYLQDKAPLELKLSRLEELNHLWQMASVIAHEVRNPMATVRGYLQLLSTKDLYYNEREIFQLMI